MRLQNLIFVCLLAFSSYIHADTNHTSKSNELPRWIYGVAILEIYFHDGSLKRSFATLLEDGYFLGSSDILDDKLGLPKVIYTKMMDDSASEIICVTTLNLKALDINRGLALMEGIGYSDDYCQKREQSFYHSRIKNKYFIDIFNPSKLQGEYMPYLASAYTLESIHINDHQKLDDFGLGQGVFDVNGDFAGIYTRIDDEDMILPKDVVYGFICDMVNEGMFKHDSSICKIAAPGKESASLRSKAKEMDKRFPRGKGSRIYYFRTYP